MVSRIGQSSWSKLQSDGAGCKLPFDGAGCKLQSDGAGCKLPSDGAGCKLPFDGAGCKLQSDGWSGSSFTPTPHACMLITPIPPLSLQATNVMGQTDPGAQELIVNFLEECDNSGNAFSDACLIACCIEGLGYLRAATPHALAAAFRQVWRVGRVCGGV
eukprot:357410-Chlamydomonas_euryale.AAC.4